MSIKRQSEIESDPTPDSEETTGTRRRESGLEGELSRALRVKHILLFFVWPSITGTQ